MERSGKIKQTKLIFKISCKYKGDTNNNKLRNKTNTNQLQIYKTINFLKLNPLFINLYKDP